MTTNYLCNEWLDEADKKVFERMKKNNPRRYQVAGLGNWGIVDGLVYENWKEEKFELNTIRNLDSAFGLDFGYTNDPTALFCGEQNPVHGEQLSYHLITKLTLAGSLRYKNTGCKRNEQ